jgi:catechol 2,3-dioxygenase-like lactoylglutathione lyase family enzyme
MLGIRRGKRAHVRGGGAAHADATVLDLIPFIYVTDIEASIAFYEALGFRLGETYAPRGRPEFAELESTAAAKLMLSRVDELPEPDAHRGGPGFFYLHARSLDALRARLVQRGYEPGRSRTVRIGGRLHQRLAARTP